jgi:anti-anti-sigma factor
MDIICRRNGPLTIVDLRGRWIIDAGEIELLELQAVVRRLIAAGSVHVVFNLRDLETLDARALGEIAETHKKLRSAGGELTIVAPNRFVRKLLAVTRLDSVIPIRETDCVATLTGRHALGCVASPAPAVWAPGIDAGFGIGR